MDSQYNRVAVLEAQMQKLQEKVVNNTSSQMKLEHLRGVQDREKEEWRESKKFLEEQLSAARQECQSLRREMQGSRNGMWEESVEPPPVSGLHRSPSSQSLPGHTATSERTGSPGSSRPSPPSSLYNYPLFSQLRPTSGSSYTSIPLANSTLLGHSHISGSSSSINSTRSANPTLGHTHSARDYGNYGHSRHKLRSEDSSQQHRLRVPYSSTPRYTSSERDLTGLGKPAGSRHYLSDRYATGTARTQSSHGLSRQGGMTSSSTTGGPPGHRTLTPSSYSVADTNVRTLTSPDVELQRSKLKIKQLEKEVLLLDDQLSDKGRSAQGHVEELMLLRTELAQEKASLAIVQQEIRDQAAREVAKVRGTHERLVKDLEGKLKRVKAERGRLEREGVDMRTKLNECGRLQERVQGLGRQLEGEKEGRARAVGKLQREVEGARTHVAKLEATLQECRAQLNGHVTKAEDDSTQHSMLIRQMEAMSQELRQKEKELGKKVELEVHLQQELASVRAELQQSHTSWQETKRDMKEHLGQSEAAREALLKQVTEASRKLMLHSAQLGGKREALGELERCRKEVQRLEGVVSAELAERGRMEAEMQRWKREKAKLEGRCKEEASRHEGLEKRWQEERSAKEACEAEGEELRKEVGRLSEELRLNQHQLQGEVEGKADSERNMEESLARLQQELAKRAQQVLEMDRLLQSHQAETTGRRLQLERTLAQRQGELRARTQEVEELRGRISECEATMEEMRGQLTQAKEDQKNLFSGSQAQLLTQGSKVTELEGKLEEAESAQARVSKEAGTLREQLAEVQEKERVWHEQCQQLQEKVKALTEDKEAVCAKHRSEAQQLQAMHSSQLTSRDQQADTHRQQLQQLTLQEKLKQEELSRCRVQATSLTAELAAERRVSDHSRQQVAMARAEVNKYKAQVASLQTSVSMLQEMFEQQSMGLQATPTHGKVTNGTMNSLPYSNNDADFVMLPNHLKTTHAAMTTPIKHQATPTSPLTPSTGNASPVTPPTSERGSIISV